MDGVDLDPESQSTLKSETEAYRELLNRILTELSIVRETAQNVYSAVQCLDSDSDLRSELTGRLELALYLLDKACALGTLGVQDNPHKALHVLVKQEEEEIQCEESEDIPGDLLECTTEATSGVHSETITENVDETKPDIQQSVIQRKRKVNEHPKERKKRRPRRGAVHEGPKFQCDVCDFQSEREATLRNHKERKHDNTYYLCQPCSDSVPDPADKENFMFKTQAQFKQHARTVHGLKYSCDVCGFKATSRGNLMSHKETQHENSKYQCKDCDFVSSSIYYLNTHTEKVHMGIRYPCDQCKHVAASKLVLKRHIQVMHEGQKFMCDQCNYSVGSMYRLKEHNQHKHQGKTFACSDCDYRGSSAENLKLHRESRHLGIRYSCNQCNFVAMRIKNLKKHMVQKHPPEKLLES